MYDNQYRFRKEHSTEFVALELINRILTHMDNKKISINIYLDLSKAFENMDHSILIHKLEFYGEKGVVLYILKTYLTHRKQYVELDEALSEKQYH